MNANGVIEATASTLGPKSYSAAAVVKRYIELRDFVADEKKRFAEQIKEFTDAMEILQGMAAVMIRDTEQRALSTEFGTAFPVHKTRVTCDDKAAFLQFVREHQAWDFLTAHVAKEAVEAYMDKFDGQVPPGIKVDGYTEIQFRKA